MKRVLILGVGGQDGSYLAELLLEKGYEVHGMMRRSATDNTQNIVDFKDKITLHQGDLADPLSVDTIIRKVGPHEIYNEADQDNVTWSKSTPAYSVDITAGAVSRLFESVRRMGESYTVKIFQPVSSTMFGEPTSWPQDENTPLAPMSPYACAKAHAFHLAKYYREKHGLYICTAILYNHTSERQNEDYLLPKICRSAVRIARGDQENLALGNLEETVDIGYAPDYMYAAWQMMQLDESDDFVIGSGYGNKIGNLVRWAFDEVGVSIDKVVIDDEYWKDISSQVPLQSRCNKAGHAFGFERKVSVERMIGKLITAYERSLR